MDSVDSNVDLELMAALIDGRLADEDRARAMQLLANSDEALEIFAQVMREQGAAHEPTVVPISEAPRRVWRTILPVAAAAGLAILLVPRMIHRRGNAVLASEYATELSRDPGFANGLPNGWEQRGWSVTRGAGQAREGAGTSPAGSPAEARSAFRLGVRTFDLQIALRHGDTALATRMAGEIVEALHAVAFSDPIAAEYDTLRLRLATDSLAHSIARASGIDRELHELLGSTPMIFGQWVAAADLAAQAHDASFFESAHGTRYIQSVSPAGVLAPADSDALRLIDQRIRGGATNPALDDVRDILQGVITRHGG